MEDGHYLAVELAKGDFEYEASEHIKGFLGIVLSEAMKSNAFALEEEIRRFLCRYIEYFKSPDRCVLRSNSKIREAFREHFRDHFALLPDLPIQKFNSNLANFLCLQEAEVACREGLVTEVHDALKQVGLNKSLSLDGVPY